jgi:hypothetical protein
VDRSTSSRTEAKHTLAATTNIGATFQAHHSLPLPPSVPCFLLWWVDIADPGIVAHSHFLLATVVKFDKFVNKVAGSQGIGEFINHYAYAAARSAPDPGLPEEEGRMLQLALWFAGRHGSLRWILWPAEEAMLMVVPSTSIPAASYKV